MSNIYIISDTHWYHENIFKFTNRPEKHNELMIANWKATVQEDDTVIHLGDIVFDSTVNLKEFLYKLPGKKILVQGNHDRKSLHFYMQNGFDFACEQMVMKNVLFSHKPIDVPIGIQYQVHGHFHTAPSVRWESDLKEKLTPKHRIFIIEHPMINYTPVKWERFFSKRFECFDTLNVLKRSEEDVAGIKRAFEEGK